jgi:electron transport complex protein RnfC
MNTFSIGGIMPPLRKHQTEDQAIQNAIIPPRATIPMLQHGALRYSGAASTPVVVAGDRVREGMVIGEARAHGSANVHSSIPGIVRSVDDLTLPDGRITKAVTIDMDGEFEQLGRPPKRREWRSLGRKSLLNAIRDAGIVGMGTDDEPLVDVLSSQSGCRTLIVNGCESQPYLTADHRLLVERAPAVLAGAEIVAAVLEAESVVFAISEHRRHASAATGTAIAERAEGKQDDAGIPAISLMRLAERYPQEDERQLVRSVTGVEIASGRDAGSVGVCTIGVATAFAVYEAVVLGRPPLERVVTVAGGAIRKPANLKVRLGTPLSELIADCGGFLGTPAKLIAGGPLTGYSISDLNLPVMKQTRAILALTSREIHARTEQPCINCGRCIMSCPMGLNPTRLYKLLDQGMAATALDEGLGDCTECGACGYICPSRIPLVSAFRRYHHGAAGEGDRG